jgi:hypothetical protein
LSHWIQYPDLKFDPVEHKYTWKGVVKPSVSTVLGSVGTKTESGYFNPVGYGTFAKQNPDLAEFGNTVHKIAPALVLKKKVLYPESMENWISKLKAYLEKESYTPLKDANGNYLIEYPMYSSGYCGTPDLIALNRKSEICAIDWKTSDAFVEHYYYQTAGYARLVREVHNLKVKHCIIVRINDNKCDHIVRTNKTDLIVFSSCLNIVKMVK